MLEITFLGTVSGIPTKERNHPAIVLEYYGKRKETLLWDCGEGTQVQLMKAKISFMDIEKIFITHWHADHFSGLIPLIASMNLEKRRKKLKIFGPEAERFVNLILDLGYFGSRFKIEAVEVPFEGEEINFVERGNEYEIYSIPVYHTVPAVAYCFKEKDKWHIDTNKLKEKGLKTGKWLKDLKKYGYSKFKNKEISLKEVAYLEKGLKIVYTGDTKPCENIVKISKDADLLIHDSTFLEIDEETDKGHADVRQAAEIAKKANVKRLVLTNFSRRYKDVSLLENEAKKIFKNCIAAKELMKIRL